MEMNYKRRLSENNINLTDLAGLSKQTFELELQNFARIITIANLMNIRIIVIK